jgi:hypothetical protein
MGYMFLHKTNLKSALSQVKRAALIEHGPLANGELISAPFTDVHLY